MTGNLWHLVIASAVFVGAHAGISSTPLRGMLVGRLGERPYLGAYSVLMAVLMVWVVMAYRAAPVVTVYDAGIGARHAALIVMWIAFFLFAAAMSPNAPAVAGGRAAAVESPPVGIFKITRHPMLWSFALWGLMHMCVNGDAASLIFFGGFTLLAVCGTGLIDRRKRATLGAAWEAYAAQSSAIPFVAILQGRARVSWREIGWRPVVIGTALYLLVLFGHRYVIGVSPLAF